MSAKYSTRTVILGLLLASTRCVAAYAVKRCVDMSLRGESYEDIERTMSGAKMMIGILRAQRKAVDAMYDDEFYEPDNMFGRVSEKVKELINDVADGDKSPEMIASLEEIKRVAREISEDAEDMFKIERLKTVNEKGDTNATGD